MKRENFTRQIRRKEQRLRELIRRIEVLLISECREPMFDTAKSAIEDIQCEFEAESIEKIGNDTPIVRLFPVRLTNKLEKYCQVFTLEDLNRIPFTEIMSIPGFGLRSAASVAKLLQSAYPEDVLESQWYWDSTILATIEMIGDGEEEESGCPEDMIA